ncbi:MAG: DEAD/DEAH box helicase, partial [Candidatus Dormibacteraeota bacterium]|nr:DEAD/DEAH box helicase [Candidatus Dormibacteraeota bacterium]
ARNTRRPLMRLAPPGAEGRWSLVSDLTSAAVTSTERLHATAGALLQRYGVLTREAALAEGSPGGFAALYPVLRAMEEGGRIRRGYFIEGLGGSQFALPGAVDRLRTARDQAPAPITLAATDPANPYGVTLPWPVSPGGRTARVPGAFLVLAGGELRIYLERGGRSVLTFGEVQAVDLAALAQVVRRLGKLEILTVNGEPAAGSHLEPAMREVGFGVSPRGLVMWADRAGGARSSA